MVTVVAAAHKRVVEDRKADKPAVVHKVAADRGAVAHMPHHVVATVSAHKMAKKGDMPALADKVQDIPGFA